MTPQSNQGLNTYGPDDSCYFKAVIAPRPRLHDGVTIEFRPPDYIVRRSDSLKMSSLMSSEKYEDVARAELTNTLSRVRDWSLSDTVQDIMNGTKRINAVLMRDIYDVVWGFEAAAELVALQKNS